MFKLMHIEELTVISCTDKNIVVKLKVEDKRLFSTKKYFEVELFSERVTELFWSTWSEIDSGVPLDTIDSSIWALLSKQGVTKDGNVSDYFYIDESGEDKLGPYIKIRCGGDNQKERVAKFSDAGLVSIVKWDNGKFRNSVKRDGV